MTQKSITKEGSSFEFLLNLEKPLYKVLFGGFQQWASTRAEGKPETPGPNTLVSVACPWLLCCIADGK